MKHRNDQKVAVAYPHPGDVDALFMFSMLRVFRWDAVGGRTSDGKKVGGRLRILDGGELIHRSTALLTRARTDIAADFLALKHRPDWLWMVDTDMTFDPDIVDRLVEAAHPVDRPIVGGLCFQYMADQPRQLWPTIYTFSENMLGRVTQYPPDELIQVAGTGAACLLVHRRVLEAMKEARPDDPRPWFAETPFTRPDGVVDVLSEDLTFCLRAQVLGFPVHVHTGIKVGHRKTFEANEAGFAAECEALAARNQPTLPTFVVCASRNRPAMLGDLLGQLAGQAHDAFVYDNGYPEPPFPGMIEAHGWPLHRMWNDGLDRAEKAAAGQPYNVLIVNDDVQIAPDFCARLEHGLRLNDLHWVAYPNHHDIDVPDGFVGPTTGTGGSGQTMSGWAFMLRGETGLRFDEQFEWWYGDSDLQKQVEAGGGQVVCVAGCQANHLDPNTSTFTDPDRLAQAKADEARFAEKWGLDPETLWLAVNQP